MAKLLVRGLALRGEPWKELIRQKADHIILPMHGKRPNTSDINWLFAAPKLKRIRHSMWKNIVGSWLNVRLGLTKADPTSSAETLRQPLFGNPSIFNASGTLLGLRGLRDGSAFARHGCTRIKDLWNPKEGDWKSLTKLEMSYHTSNRKCKEAITASIPWRPDECASHPQPGEWIGILNPNPTSPFD